MCLTKHTAAWQLPMKRQRMPGLRRYDGDYLMIRNKADTPPRYESGGAGLLSTIDDYARFAQMLLNGGSLDGTRILSPRTVQYLTSGELTPPQQAAMRRFGGHEGYTYSHLLRRLIDPGQACLMSEAGSTAGRGGLAATLPTSPDRT